MDPALRVARAACGLAALACVAALWPIGPGRWDPVGGRPACSDPREARAELGHTRIVDCRPGARGGPVRGPARLLFGLGLDPNRADAETLSALPGIGPARARAIVEGRRAGPYRTARDLTRVHGIGDKTALHLRPWLCFGGREAGLQERR